MIDKMQIKHNFGRHAARYDRYAAVQAQVGRTLLACCPRQDVQSVIDLGCGTGGFTQHLRDLYPAARITAVDVSGQMIARARDVLGQDHIQYRVADAETFAFSEAPDLIASNACLQWFMDPERALTRYRKALGPHGSLVFSVFGPRTFCELGDVFSRLLGHAAELSVKAFPDYHIYECLLRRLFTAVQARHVFMEQTYASLWDLLVTIKYTGARGHGLPFASFSRRNIDRLDALYRATYGRIVATYEVGYFAGQQSRIQDSGPRIEELGA